MNVPHDEQGLIQEYLDGRLPTEQRARLELHLSVCDRCRSDVKTLRKIEATLRGLPPESPGKHFTSAVMRQILPPSTPASFRVLEYAAYLFGFLIVVTATISVLLLAGVIQTGDVSPSSLTGEVAAHFRATVGDVLGWIRGVVPFAFTGSGGKVAVIGALSLALVAVVDRLYIRWSGHRS
jgi:anti-sigma factor RsiW